MEVYFSHELNIYIIIFFLKVIETLYLTIQIFFLTILKKSQNYERKN